MEHVVLKHKRTTLERAEKFISPIYFTDVNLQGRLYRNHTPVKSIKHYAARDRIPFSEAVVGTYTDVKLGQAFGPTWATHWFCLDIEVPQSLEEEEIHLLWDSGSEAMVWEKNGTPLQGLNSNNDRKSFALSKVTPTQKNRYILYVEMACNGLFGAGKDGFINAPDENKTFALVKAEIAVFDRKVYDLIMDVETLHDMAKHLPKDSERGYQALYTVNRLINTVNVEDRSTYESAHQIAKEFFSQENGASQHLVYAMGHAHIDTAWLWPYAETIRKCARSWSCAIGLMEQFPHYTFTCSQAQQYEWVKEHYPALYTKMTNHIKRGYFIPVGGTWVEMDGNLPSGESFLRQFLYGQRFFQKEFGIKCTEFWLPDTFGYSPQLPQIMKLCGISRFLTQKLSWSLINKFPHHTFWWEGIDGTRVLTHFPPGDSYEMKGKVSEVLHTQSNFADKGRSNRSMYLFGFGDGGHGPSEDMLQRLERLEDVDGIPKVRMSTPDEYFTAVEDEDAENLCRWRGELYLELHNGTYTTHAQVKKMNRVCEFLLHDAEFLSSISSILKHSSAQQHKYPSQELLRLWKLLLLNQFHDVLPGSSIGMVYTDSHQHYKDIVKSCEHLKREAVKTLLSGTPSNTSNETNIIINTQGWDRTEVITLLDSEGENKPAKKTKTATGNLVQIDCFGNTLAMVSAPSYGYSVVQPLACTVPATVVKDSKGSDLFYFENEYLKAAIDPHGRISSIQLQGSKRNGIKADYDCYGNRFVLFDDIPLYWDAWDVMDYHLETRKPVDEYIRRVVILDTGPLRASAEFTLKISDKSYIKQVISLDAGCPYLKFDTEVHWHESHKFLKVEFPTSVHATQATYEIQCGHLQRTNHNNTSWDWAQYEVCGHKWAVLSEYNFGVAVLNDCKYGYSVRDGVIRLSLLRSPKAPDQKADMGVHHFTYALQPFQGTFQSADVIKNAYNLNSQLQQFSLDLDKELPDQMSYFFVHDPQVVLETIKKSEDDDRCVVLRLYESFGGQANVTLTINIPFKSCHKCDALEEIDESLNTNNLRILGNNITLTLGPFEITSLMVRF